MADTKLSALTQGMLPDVYYGLDQSGNSRKFSSIRAFNVRDYGALGNGVHDDTSAIQAAISAATAIGGTVYFPAGDYIITSRLNVPAGPYSISLVGVGAWSGHGDASRCGSTITGSFNDFLLKCAYSSGTNSGCVKLIRGISFLNYSGNNTFTSTENATGGIYFAGSMGAIIESCEIGVYGGIGIYNIAQNSLIIGTNILGQFNRYAVPPTFVANHIGFWTAAGTSLMNCKVESFDVSVLVAGANANCALVNNVDIEVSGYGVQLGGRIPIDYYDPVAGIITGPSSAVCYDTSIISVSTESCYWAGLFIYSASRSSVKNCSFYNGVGSGDGHTTAINGIVTHWVAGCTLENTLVASSPSTSAFSDAAIHFGTDSNQMNASTVRNCQLSGSGTWVIVNTPDAGFALPRFENNNFYVAFTVAQLPAAGSVDLVTGHIVEISDAQIVVTLTPTYRAVGVGDWGAIKGTAVGNFTGGGTSRVRARWSDATSQWSIV